MWNCIVKGVQYDVGKCPLYLLICLQQGLSMTLHNILNLSVYSHSLITFAIGHMEKRGNIYGTLTGMQKTYQYQ